jgi:hypothetical protein
MRATGCVVEDHFFGQTREAPVIEGYQTALEAGLPVRHVRHLARCPLICGPVSPLCAAVGHNVTPVTALDALAGAGTGADHERLVALTLARLTGVIKQTSTAFWLIHLTSPEVLM